MKRKLEYIEDKRASKMARIEEVKAGNDNSGVLVKKVQEEIEDAKKYNSALWSKLGGHVIILFLGVFFSNTA